MASRIGPGLCRALSAVVLTAVTAADARAQAGRDSARTDTTRRLPDLEVRGVRPVLTTGGAAAVRARLDSLPLPPGATLEQTLR